MKTRTFLISNFRNIGISTQDKDFNEVAQTQSLLLNVAFDSLDSKDSNANIESNFGGLVIIIGENNTGKSNVSRALSKFMFNDSEIFKESDYTNFLGCYKFMPTLTLKVREKDTGENPKIIESSISITQENRESEAIAEVSNEIDFLRSHLIKFATKKKEQMATGIDTLDSINATFKQSNKIALIIDEAFKTNSKDRILNLFDELDNVPDMTNYDKEAKKEFDKLKASSQEIIKEFDEENRANNIFGYARNQINKDFQGIYNKLIINLNNAKDYETIKPLYKDLTNFINDAISHHNNARYGMYDDITMETDFLIPQEIDKSKKENLKQQILDLLSKATFSTNAKSILPKIIYYNNSLRFNNKDLITNIDSIESSEFFNALCNIAKIDISSLKNAYKNSAKSTAYLTAEMEDINKRISRFVTQEFNKLYKKNGSDIYEFNFALSQNQISLEIFTNEKKVVKELDLQSSGFQWFFNLFFGLLYGKGLQKDSIVIMDEPAHNLSVPARKEFRDFLKSYGQKNGITFVVITHDPFLADIDYLDEIRIVQNLESKNGVEIVNDFSSIKSSDTDALCGIKKAFGVHIDFFYKPKMRLIFVEGITDYNYLTTFKILLERDGGAALNLAFLPIGGLGIKGEEEKILKGLCELHESPILLVDSDKAGAAIKECAKKLKLESLSIIELKEIDSKFKDIESCFDSKDLETFNIAFSGDSKVDSKGDSKLDSKAIKGYKESHALKTAILNNKLELSETTKANFNKILKHLNEL